MNKYIDAEKLIAHIKRQQRRLILLSTKQVDMRRDCAIQNGVYDNILDIITSLQQEQPEPYFYCKYGGTIPLCSDCKRNYNNSSFKTEEITTWYVPSNGTKHCIDYIQQKQVEVDLDKEIENFLQETGAPYFWTDDSDQLEWLTIVARHFYELGLRRAAEMILSITNKEQKRIKI